MKKLYHVMFVVVLASLVLAACGAGSTPAPTDLLDAIKQRGYILVSTDPNYEPQSFLNTEGSRPSDTRDKVFVRPFVDDHDIRAGEPRFVLEAGIVGGHH